MRDDRPSLGRDDSAPPELVERANAGLHPHVASALAGLAPDRDCRILDFGCGTGAFLDRLARAGYRSLTGVDIALPATPAPHARFLECDLDVARLPCPASSFDVILAIEVMEHFQNPGFVLSEWARLLESGGHVLMTTPNVHSLEARLRLLLLNRLKQFDELGDPTHVSPIFVYPFTRLARSHGFEIVRVWGHPTDGSSPTSRRMLRWAASTIRLTGAHADPAGDQLCMILKRAASDVAGDAEAKKEALTSHYLHGQSGEKRAS